MSSNEISKDMGLTSLSGGAKTESSTDCEVVGIMMGFGGSVFIKASAISKTIVIFDRKHIPYINRIFIKPIVSILEIIGSTIKVNAPPIFINLFKSLCNPFVVIIPVLKSTSAFKRISQKVSSPSFGFKEVLS